MTSDEYVMVHLNGGTKETALDVYRALGGAFTPKPSTDIFLAPGESPVMTGPPDVWARGFRVDGPGRPIGANHRLVGEITAEIVGARDRVGYLLDVLRAFAEVGEPSTDDRAGAATVTVHLRPA